ncbi:FAD-dependent oxidoreductase [Chloroflexota bacterium]
MIVDIPYRCFLAKKIDNLLLAGDNISMEHAALLHVRGFATAIRLGEVAGTAVALAVKNGIKPREVKWSAPF